MDLLTALEDTARRLDAAGPTPTPPAETGTAEPPGRAGDPAGDPAVAAGAAAADLGEAAALALLDVGPCEDAAAYLAAADAFAAARRELYPGPADPPAPDPAHDPPGMYRPGRPVRAGRGVDPLLIEYAAAALAAALVTALARGCARAGHPDRVLALGRAGLAAAAAHRALTRMPAR